MRRHDTTHDTSKTGWERSFRSRTSDGLVASQLPASDALAYSTRDLLMSPIDRTVSYSESIDLIRSDKSTVQYSLRYCSSSVQYAGSLGKSQGEAAQGWAKLASTPRPFEVSTSSAILL